MLLLRDFGLPASSRQARKACTLLLDRGLQRDGGINYGWRGQSETCITGMVLSILSYFECDDDRLDTIATHLLEQQMPDGGWNCARPRGATHASVHTTISALEGLRFYELHRRRNVRAVRAAQRRGREFLLMHRLFRSHRTGQIIKPQFIRFSFPPRWHYDILRALDYFQAVNALRDERLSDAIVRATRGAPALTLGASPRASVALLKLAQAAALVDGREYVIPDDVKELATAVLRHRVIVAPELELEGVTADAALHNLIDRVEAPHG